MPTSRGLPCSFIPARRPVIDAAESPARAALLYDLELTARLVPPASSEVIEEDAGGGDAEHP